jgi:hypothetical protein
MLDAGSVSCEILQGVREKIPAASPPIAYGASFVSGPVIAGAPSTSAPRGSMSEEVVMPRRVGDRYQCEKCGAVLVYEKPCPCPEGMPHSEICCGQQMTPVTREGSGEGK